MLLNKTFGCVRYAWNQWVESFNKKTNVFKTVKELREETGWMKEVSFGAIQQKSWRECKTLEDSDFEAIPDEMSKINNFQQF